MNRSVIDGLPFSQLERLRFIERQLMWGRSLNARMLMAKFGVSRAQVVKDIKLYMELFPKNIAPYQPTEKAYTPSRNFEPFLTSGLPEADLEGSLLCRVPVIQRQVGQRSLSIVLSAIQEEKAIEFIYASATDPVGRRRIVAPSRILSASNRLHFRGYCFERKDYRDFVVSRCLTTPKIKNLPEPRPIDEQWKTLVEVHLKPNPGLPPKGQKLIALEFGEALDQPVTLSGPLFHYFLLDNHLPSSKADFELAKSNPWAFPVVWISSSANSFLFDKVTHTGGK